MVERIQRGFVRLRCPSRCVASSPPERTQRRSPSGSTEQVARVPTRFNTDKVKDFRYSLKRHRRITKGVGRLHCTDQRNKLDMFSINSCEIVPGRSPSTLTRTVERAHIAANLGHQRGRVVRFWLLEQMVSDCAATIDFEARSQAWEVVQMGNQMVHTHVCQ